VERIILQQHLSDSRLVIAGSQTIIESFDNFHLLFRSITRRAKIHFEQRHWLGMQEDTTARLDLYTLSIDQLVTGLNELLKERIADKLIWAGIKAVYSGKIAGRDDWELAETFFNSVTRRIFSTIGVDPQIEFVDTDFSFPPGPSQTSVYRTFKAVGRTSRVIRDIIAVYGLNAPFQNLDEDAELVAVEVENHLKNIGLSSSVDRIEMLKYPFFRGVGAYLVGRIFSDSRLVPLVISLLNDRQGIYVDGLLMNEGQVSILFSFTRSYFQVEIDRPYDGVAFLKTLIPHKRIAEIYTSIGYNKHGKTEFFRDLQNHILTCCFDRFEISKGKKGMVMIVFNMPNDNQVFKVIRDTFIPPKKTTRRKVMEKYDFVFKHDRAGRMVEAQTFEHLRFNLCCFTEELMEELRKNASTAIRFEADSLIVRHAYVERRVTPLDIYLREADEADVESAVIDYGNAIKDLAFSNIFPGDMLIKNFGVTRKGRVVFYDYDEIFPLTECNFREIPQSRRYDDELSSEPWFHVGENDVFPEEWPRFLGLRKNLVNLLMEKHGDLFQVDFWHRTQEKLRSGQLIHIFPYSRKQKLRSSLNKQSSFKVMGVG
jgi:isocitrate dehydrogenase kinase/phosphatase